MHSYLGSNDHARIAGVCLRTIRRWKARAGLSFVERRRPPGWRRLQTVLLAPSDWSAGTWLEDRYAEGHGIRAIARAINRSYTATRRQLWRRGVLFRSAREAVRSRHACCNRHWLLEHYVVGGLSLTRCARLAGVSTATFTTWLIRFEIRVRSNGEQQMHSREAAVRDRTQAPPTPPRVDPASGALHSSGARRSGCCSCKGN